ncbi:hypothetical protein AVEN_274335-1 [Araneus ventricosus]|uniref:SF3 helicase domain-containing protein n=1 Tax=Araneus ventricosus TaxID=182803 RepID=A0A4Y2BT84_ARAVE|nr:hypothetical protein AVEN_274335-1 [Araneus ventricosus]
MLMYILDVLASAFIATNYERKFFVLKGLTSNGKSKLFELLGKVFGGYFHNIQSDNLKPGSATSNATPELASTLFSCRVLTLEELKGKLNENRVKQITGNSHVTFRNMYENNVGGIPTTKVFCTTNKLPECQATKAFEEHVVALPFHATFSDKAPTTTAEQVRQNVYPKDTDLNLGSFRYVSVLDRLESSQPQRIENACLQEDDDEEDPVNEEVHDEPASKRMKSSPTTQQSVVFYY